VEEEVPIIEVSITQIASDILFIINELKLIVIKGAVSQI